MQRHALLALVLAACVLGASASAAAAATGELSATPGTIEAEPGDSVEVTLTLQHTGSNTTAYIVDADLPDGFAAENSNIEEVRQEGNAKWLLPTLEPDSSMEVTFDLHVPEDAAGSYEVPIVAETVDGVQARATLTVDTPGERTETATAASSTDETAGTETGTNGTDAAGDGTDGAGNDGTEANAMQASASASNAPGFGVVAALLAVSVAIVAVARRGG